MEFAARLNVELRSEELCIDQSLCLHRHACQCRRARERGRFNPAAVMHSMQASANCACILNSHVAEVLSDCPIAGGRSLVKSCRRLLSCWYFLCIPSPPIPPISGRTSPSGPPRPWHPRGLVLRSHGPGAWPGASAWHFCSWVRRSRQPSWSVVAAVAADDRCRGRLCDRVRRTVL